MKITAIPARFVALSLLLAALAGCSKHSEPEYGLPIKLGSTSDEVRLVLGAPNERYSPPQKGDTNVDTNPDRNAERVLEWYYSTGIVGIFERDRLAMITLNTYTDYAGFVPYTGTVVNGVRLTDDKQTILNKLGAPTKVEPGNFERGTNPDIPVVWPKESNYYWRFKDFMVEATFLDQAQSVSEEKHLVFPKDTLIAIHLSR